jgi:hypothetical protein
MVSAPPSPPLDNGAAATSTGFASSNSVTLSVAIDHVQDCEWTDTSSRCAYSANNADELFVGHDDGTVTFWKWSTKKGVSPSPYCCLRTQSSFPVVSVAMQISRANETINLLYTGGWDAWYCVR